MIRSGAGEAALAFELQDNLKARTEAAIKAALAEGWSGTIWSWMTMRAGQVYLHVSRNEPE